MRPVIEQALGKPDKSGRIPRSHVEPEALRRNMLARVAEQIGSVLTQGRGALRESALNPPPADWAKRTDSSRAAINSARLTASGRTPST